MRCQGDYHANGDEAGMVAETCRCEAQLAHNVLDKIPARGHEERGQIDDD